MSYSIKFFKSLMHAAGFDFHLLRPGSNPAYQLLKALDRFGVDVVLDVGANVGQFAAELRSVGYRGKLVSFEPLSSVHHTLTKAASRDAKWFVHPRCAIGDQDREIQINIAGNSYSSSVLPMLESHSSAAENSAYVDAEMVPMFKLDSVAQEYLEKSRCPFLKIDTQGFESQVLDGASEILPRMRGVLCELSLVPLYDGQRLWTEMIRRLEGEGFTLWSIQEAFVDPRDGRTLQLDATFFRV